MRMTVINKGGVKPINLEQVSAEKTMQKSQDALIYGAPGVSGSHQ